MLTFTVLTVRRASVIWGPEQNVISECKNNDSSVLPLQFEHCVSLKIFPVTFSSNRQCTETSMAAISCSAMALVFWGFESNHLCKQTQAVTFLSPSAWNHTLSVMIHLLDCFLELWYNNLLTSPRRRPSLSFCFPVKIFNPRDWLDREWGWESRYYYFMNNKIIIAWSQTIAQRVTLG